MRDPFAMRPNPYCDLGIRSSGDIGGIIEEHYMEESGKPKYCIPLVTGCFTEDILGLLSPFLVPTKYVSDNHWGRTLARLATTGRAIERLVRWWMRSLDIRSRWLPVKAFRWFSNVMQAIPLHLSLIHI